MKINLKDFPSKLEIHLRRYKSIYGLASVVIGLSGLGFSFWNIIDGQREAAQKQAQATKEAAEKQAKAAKEAYVLILEEKDSDLKTMDAVTRFAQSLAGYVIERNPKKPDGTPLSTQGRVSSSSGTVALYSGTVSKLRSGYIDAYSRFELNNSAIASMSSILDHLLAKNTPKSDTDNHQADQARIRTGNNIIAPQITAKANSFDPTERAASLVLAAHLANSSKIVEITKAPVTNFSNSFLGYLDYQDLNLTHFNLSGSDFFHANFKGAIFNETNLSNTSFERAVFRFPSSWSHVKQEQLGNTIFRGAIFREKSEFNDKASLKKADFSISPYIPTPNPDTNLNRAQSTEFAEVAFHDIALSGATFKGAILHKATFQNITLNPPKNTDQLAGETWSISFAAAPAQPAIGTTIPAFPQIVTQLKEVYIEDCDFPQSSFQNAEVGKLIVQKKTNPTAKAIFTDSNFCGLSLHQITPLKTLKFLHVDLSRSRFSPSEKTPSESLPADLSESEFESCCLDDVWFGEANFANRGKLIKCEGGGTALSINPARTPILFGGEFHRGAFLAGIRNPEHIKGTELNYCFISDEIARKFHLTPIPSSSGEGGIYLTDRGVSSNFLIILAPPSLPAAAGSKPVWTLTGLLKADVGGQFEITTDSKTVEIKLTMRESLDKIGIHRKFPELTGSNKKITKHDIQVALKDYIEGVTINWQ